MTTRGRIPAPAGRVAPADVWLTPAILAVDRLHPRHSGPETRQNLKFPELATTVQGKPTDAPAHDDGTAPAASGNLNQ
ncbi:hypothetical protein AB4Y63_15080 [Leifsonia sp. YAF41]|uniref:hypothetical protein n=1 Tax=Leifsonia sp. YAF41 TaxID=3233086 RepID=UPI003F94CEBA